MAGRDPREDFIQTITICQQRRGQVFPSGEGESAPQVLLAATTADQVAPNEAPETTVKGT